ncbi:MAG: PIN domain-containing protein [Leptospiraceae bacterium]|nr:PIN domain-containing protein [Leptospiraceae bacterium]
MISLVVNANIIFSFFSPKSKAREIAISGEVKLFSPQFLLKELDKHKDEVKEKFGLNETRFQLVLELVKAVVEFIPLEDFKEFIEEASRISPDRDDIQYLALSLKLGTPLWSNDNRLKQQLRVKIVSTKELIEILK